MLVYEPSNPTKDLNLSLLKYRVFAEMALLSMASHFQEIMSLVGRHGPTESSSSANAMEHHET